MLNRPGVLAVIGKLVTAGMAEHVAVNEKWESRSLARPRNHSLIGSNAQRRRGARKLGTAGRAEHVAVNDKWESRSLASPRNHSLIASNAQRRLGVRTRR